MLLAWNWLFQKFEFCSNSRNHSKGSMAGSKARFRLDFEARFLVSQNTSPMLEITVYETHLMHVGHSIIAKQKSTFETGFELAFPAL